MWTWMFWRAALERAIQVAAAATAGALGANVLAPLDVINWQFVVNTAALSALVSLLWSLANGTVTKGRPGLTEAPLPPRNGSKT